MGGAAGIFRVDCGEELMGSCKWAVGGAAGPTGEGAECGRRVGRKGQRVGPFQESENYLPQVGLEC